jgi:tetratricopeptide (TPR) repeat protein
MLILGKKKIQELEEEIRSLQARLKEQNELHAARLKEGEEREAALRAEAEARAGERDQRIARLERELKRAEAEQEALRKWAERQLRLAFDELKEVWAALKLPVEYEECREPLPDKKRERLAALVERLEAWMQHLRFDIGESHLYFGLWHRLLGSPKEACKHLEIAAGKAVGDHVWRMLGDCCMELNRPEKAEEAYAHCIRDPKVPPYVLLNFAKSSLKRRNYADAVETLERLIASHPKELEHYTLAAYAMGMARQYDKAVTLSQKAQEIFPDRPEVFAKMIIPLARIGRMNDARLAFERALKLDEKFAEAYFAFGVAHLDKDEARAKEYLEKAIALDEAYAEAHFCMGTLYNQQENYKAALKHLKTAVKLNPEYGEAWYAMKTAYEGLRDFDKAIAALKKATAILPNYKL